MACNLTQRPAGLGGGGWKPPASHSTKPKWCEEFASWYLETERKKKLKQQQHWKLKNICTSLAYMLTSIK